MLLFCPQKFYVAKMSLESFESGKDSYFHEIFPIFPKDTTFYGLIRIYFPRFCVQHVFQFHVFIRFLLPCKDVPKIILQRLSIKRALKRHFFISRN